LLDVLPTSNGTTRLFDTIEVASGWNLIGGLSFPVDVQNVQTVPTGIISGSFFGYNNIYYRASVIEPEQGYWIKAKQPGKLILNASSVNVRMSRTSLPLVSGESDSSIQDVSMLTFKEKNGNEQRLYFAPMKHELNLDAYELPPKAPAESFDVRYISGRAIEAVEPGASKCVSIDITAAEYPLTISWEVKSHALTSSLEIDGHKISLQHNGSTSIKHPASSISILLTGSPNIPSEFSLEQNYPNPFNPTTVIRYQLPVESKVTLKIYDILGQEVKTLVDQTEDAGFRIAEWNSTNNSGFPLASSVYFYRLSAESVSNPHKSFVSVKKMILIK
jgi:hypothetical protein